jgi:CBS domain-containing protein
VHHYREFNVKIQDVMTRDPRSVSPQTTAREAAQLMKAEDVGIIPVVDGSRLVGVVTDRDLAVRVVAEGRDASTTVRDVMSSNRIATCRPEEDIDRAMETMAKEQVRRIPIVDERGALVGIVAQADVVRKAENDRKAEKTVERISEPGQQAR